MNMYKMCSNVNACWKVLWSDISWSVYQLKMLLSVLTSIQQFWLSFISIATGVLYFAKQNEAKWDRIKWNEMNKKVTKRYILSAKNLVRDLLKEG